MEKFGGLIEVPDGLDERMLRRLVLAAYGASRRRPLALLVSEGQRERVEALLDEGVAQLGIRMAGVFFVRRESEDPLALAATAPLVVAATPRFRTQVGARGIPYVSLLRALTLLERAGPDTDADRSTGRGEDGGRAAGVA